MPRAVLLFIFLSLSACREARVALDRMEPRTPHERYAERLRLAGLDDGPLGRRWLDAADQALRAPAAVTLPFREVGYFAAGEPRAAGFRVQLRRGDRLVVQVSPGALEPGALFLDLFRLEGDSAAPDADHVASADADGVPRLEEEIDEAGTYLVRLQPEAMHAVRYTLEIRTVPTLAFPVHGRDDRAVRSFWGAARDGGRRSHAGIDIFAPRGTPVVAVAPGVVRRVQETAIGGRVVWVYDAERNQSIYYAHLDRQLVSAGEQVDIGDTLGTVGNTGNARTTPPHLHFGIYRRGEGSLDPFPFIMMSRGVMTSVTADTGALGGWLRAAGSGATLRSSPDGGRSRAIPVGTALAALGAAGRSYRVSLPDGTIGWVSDASSEPADDAIGSVRATVVRDRPASPALAIDSLARSSTLPVLARFGDRLLVRTPQGVAGWVVTSLD